MHSSPKWGCFKQEAMKCAIERSPVLYHENKEEQCVLFQNLVKLYELACRNPGLFRNDVNVEKAQIHKYGSEKYVGAWVRSHHKRVLLGEQPTRRALCDERRGFLEIKKNVEIKIMLNTYWANTVYNFVSELLNKYFCQISTYKSYQ